MSGRGWPRLRRGHQIEAAGAELTLIANPLPRTGDDAGRCSTPPTSPFMLSAVRTTTNSSDLCKCFGEVVFMPVQLRWN